MVIKVQKLSIISNIKIHSHIKEFTMKNFEKQKRMDWQKGMSGECNSKNKYRNIHITPIRIKVKSIKIKKFFIIMNHSQNTIIVMRFYASTRKVLK